MEGYRDIPTRPLTSPLVNGHQSSWRFVATKQNNLLLQLMSSDPQIVQLRYDDIFFLDTFGQKEKEGFVVEWKLGSKCCSIFLSYSPVEDKIFSLWNLGSRSVQVVCWRWDIFLEYFTHRHQNNTRTVLRLSSSQSERSLSEVLFESQSEKKSRIW